MGVLISYVMIVSVTSLEAVIVIYLIWSVSQLRRRVEKLEDLILRD